MLKYLITFSFFALYLTFIMSFNNQGNMKCDCEQKESYELTIYEKRFK